MQIGYFDEFYEYFLEETDACLRLLNAGYTIHHTDVTVDHYVQPSHNRRDRRHLTCWYALAKNTTYFALKRGCQRCDREGQVIPTGLERADYEQQRTEQEKQHADEANARAQRLAEHLRSLGVEIDSEPSG